MIISENHYPPYALFHDLLANTDAVLNADARSRETYYQERSWQDLEKDVFNAVTRCAENTEFEGSIKLVAGAKFPDILVNEYYGIEVKSARGNNWVSTGGSILESTRHSSVNRIYLTFCKIGQPVEFLSKPYEKCLSDIAVTHYPRYKIDMRLSEGETIFDKIGIPYDELRVMENPVRPISRYYSSQLRDGEQLWWSTEGAEKDEGISAIVRTWAALPIHLKDEYTARGLAYFPEIVTEGSMAKYNRFSLWLATEKGIIHNNVRDTFSSGGKVKLKTRGGIIVSMPAVMGRIYRHRDLIQSVIDDEDETDLEKYWDTTHISQNRILQWCILVSRLANASESFERNLDILKDIFRIKN